MATGIRAHQMAESSMVKAVKPRHAAALALALTMCSVGCKSRKTFWMLMLPPVGQDGHFEPSAPIGQWKTFGRPFSSREACEQAKKAAVDFATNQAPSFFGKTFKDFGPSQLSNMEAGVSASKCISSDEIEP
jgi:hypothetical protein